MKFLKNLASGYDVFELTQEEFQPYFEPNIKKLFYDISLIYSARDFVEPSDKDSRAERSTIDEGRVMFRFAVFKGPEFVGWSVARQESVDKVYMMNSAILEGHRRRGLYEGLANLVVESAFQLGFLEVYSRHLITNNAILIAKLKLGFTISSFELSDQMGTLVHLVKYSHPARKRIMEYRAGAVRHPDEEVKKMLSLE